jgi:hypothetical protein
VNSDFVAAITKRGWFVIGFLLASCIFAFTYATRDLCWIGFDVVSCSVMIDGVVNK